MSISFPAALDTLTNPTSTNPQNGPSHSEQHADANDAIEALEAKVGIDGSAVPTSLEYRVSQLEDADSVIQKITRAIQLHSLASA